MSVCASERPPGQPVKVMWKKGREKTKWPPDGPFNFKGFGYFLEDFNLFFSEV